MVYLAGDLDHICTCFPAITYNLLQFRQGRCPFKIMIGNDNGRIMEPGCQNDFIEEGRVRFHFYVHIIRT